MEDYHKVQMKRGRRKQGYCYRLYKRLTSSRGCVWMKTSKFKVKVCCGLETRYSGCSFTFCLIVCCRFFCSKVPVLMWETLLCTPVLRIFYKTFWARVAKIKVVASVYHPSISNHCSALVWYYNLLSCFIQKHDVYLKSFFSNMASVI